jgi:hypothetical protein
MCYIIESVRDLPMDLLPSADQVSQISLYHYPFEFVPAALLGAHLIPYYIALAHVQSCCILLRVLYSYIALSCLKCECTKPLHSPRSRFGHFSCVRALLPLPLLRLGHSCTARYHGQLLFSSCSRPVLVQYTGSPTASMYKDLRIRGARAPARPPSLAPLAPQRAHRSGPRTIVFWH